MCDVGSRCFSDSCKTAVSLQKKLDTTVSKLTDTQERILSASSKGNFGAYSKARKLEGDLIAKKELLIAEIRHNQRDIDGTKTGAGNLEKEIAVANSDKEVAGLLLRQRTASAMRFARKHAAEVNASGYVPMLRVA